MNPVGIPCNACVTIHCGECVADKLARNNWIKDARDHCSCAAKGHNSNATPMKQRNVKSMLGSKRDTDGPAAEPEVVDEREVD